MKGLKEFYSAVLPRQGNLCLLTLPSAHHHWCNTIDELVTLTAQIERRYPDDSIYFATAGFKARDRHAFNADKLRCLRIDIDAGEDKYKKDPDNTYPTQRAALISLMGFVTETGLKPSFLVDSGHGWHVYWALAEDLEVREWQPLADSLKQLCITKGLKQDRRITADAARVLRPIGTMHVKSGKTVTVKSASERRWSKGELRALLPEVAPEAQRRYRADDPLAGLGNIPAFGDASINAEATIPEVPSDANLVRQGCSAIDTAASPGATVGYDYWRGVLGVAKFTRQGEEAAHAWSEHYPGYDSAETEEKYHSWATGPATCKYMADFHPGCKTCPHWGKITTPVELGRARVVQSQVITLVASPAAAPPTPPGVYPDLQPTSRQVNLWDGYLPEGSEVVSTTTGRALTKMVPVMVDGQPKTTDDGQVVMKRIILTPEPFWFTLWGRGDMHNSAMLSIRVLHHKGSPPVDYTFEQGSVASPKDLAKTLADFGIHTREAIHMRNHVLDSIELIKNIADRPVVSDRMGMRFLRRTVQVNGVPEEREELVAVHGNHIIFPDGHIERALITEDLKTVANSFHLPIVDQPSGNWGPEVWPGVEARAARYTQFLKTFYGSSPKFQLAIMLGLASPFMAFVTASYTTGAELPRTGLTVSMYSRQSARGKTTAAQAAMLAFGRPEELTANGSATGSTDNARITRLSMSGTMPMFVDEVGRNEAQKAASFVDTVANGAARDRATKTGGLKAGVPWALIALVTSNVSARQMITVEQSASDAIQQRLLEIDMSDLPDHSAMQLEQFRHEWGLVQAECAGALGAIIHREIAKLGATGVNQLIEMGMKQADRHLQGVQSGRFAARAFGAVIALYAILHKLPAFREIFPLGPVIREFKRAYDSGQSYIAENTLPSDPVQQFSMLLHDIRAKTLVTNYELRDERGNKPAVFNPHREPPQQIVARRCTAEGKLFISLDAVTEWCRAKQLEAGAFVRQLGDAGVLNVMVEGQHGTNRWANWKTLTRGVDTDINGKAKSINVNVEVYLSLVGDDPLAMAPAQNTDNVRPIR